MNLTWEYLTYVFNVDYGMLVGPKLDGQLLTNTLNKYGAEGWELVSLMPLSDQSGSSSVVNAVFKRPAAVN